MRPPQNSSCGKFAPAKLVFACVVYDVEHGGYGAKIAGPMFAKFLEELRRDKKLAEEYM